MTSATRLLAPLAAAAEMVASCCDLGVFICGIILITKTSWTAAERRSMGLAMLAMQVGPPPRAASAACRLGAPRLPAIMAEEEHRASGMVRHASLSPSSLAAGR